MNASCKYVQYKVNVSENQVTTLKDAIRLKKGDRVMLLTPAHIRMSARQVAKNVSYTGGFLGMLPSLAARSIPLADRALPTILTGLTTGLLSGVNNKAISGSGAAVGDGLYLHKQDKCYRIQKCKRDGLYLAPHPLFVESDGLFLKHDIRVNLNLI